MPLYDFACRDGHVTEKIRPQGVETVDCACGLVAERTGVNVGIGIVGPTTDTRGMYRRYTEASAEIAHNADRYERDTGQAAPELGLWSSALATAQSMAAAGEAPAVRMET